MLDAVIEAVASVVSVRVHSQPFRLGTALFRFGVMVKVRGKWRVLGPRLVKP